MSRFLQLVLLLYSVLSLAQPNGPGSGDLQSQFERAYWDLDTLLNDLRFDYCEICGYLCPNFERPIQQSFRKGWEAMSDYGDMLDETIERVRTGLVR